MASLNDFSHEEKELLLDMGQLVLDIIGIFEPTPFADATNALISIWRGDWTGAAASGAGAVLPYAGDLAKAAKLPRYLASIDKAIGLARTNARFAEALRPVFEKIVAAIRKVPLDKLPTRVRSVLEDIHRKISDFLPGGGARLSRLDRLTDDVLTRVFGSTRNVGLLPRQNVRTLVEFFERNNVGGNDPAHWAELLKGIDLHAAKPVEIIRFRPGELVAQYVEQGRPVERRVGQWMVRARGAVSHRNIGLSGADRIRKVYRVKQPVEMVKSKAAAAADHWTLGGAKPHTAVTTENGQRVMKPAEQVSGGGDQYFLPRAWEFLEEVP